MSRTEAVVTAETYYWNILALEEKRKTLDGYEALLNSLKKDVEAAHEAGLTQRSDVLKVEMELSKIEANRLALDNGVRLLEKALCQHIGVEYREDMQLESSLGDAADPSSERVDPAAAVSTREEYKLLDKAVEAERLQKKIAVGESMPELAVGASLAAMDVMDETDTNMFLFATLNVPISAWWGGYHKIKSHDAKVRAAENRLEDKAELMRIQVDKTYDSLQEAYQQYGVALSRLSQTEEHLKVVTDNYTAGVVGTSDLLEAQAMRQEANDGVVDAKVRYKLAHLLYRQAINDVDMPE